MTAKNMPETKAAAYQGYVLPSPPPREPEDMTSFKHLTRNGSVHHLIQYLGNQDTTIVEAELYLIPRPRVPLAGRRIPDLMVAFNTSPEMYARDNGYIISNQGKPPDFVLEVASRSTGSVDLAEKREYYAAMGVGEYWRFDETGEYHGEYLAGDTLIEGSYQPVPIETLADGSRQGYSSALNLILRWNNGQLGWHDPETGRHIATFHEIQQARLAERQARLEEQQARIEERQARLAAEARVRELEAEVERLRQGG